jgi:hypothetical protein
MADEQNISQAGVALHDWSKTKQSWSSLDRGLDLSKPDVTTVQEWQSWREHDRRFRGYPLPSYELIAAVGRTDVVKRWFQQIPHFYDPDGAFNTTAGWVHYYCLSGFTEGVLYEIDNCESQGHSREEVSEIIALAFLHAVSDRGMFGMLEPVTKRLELYAPKTQIAYPEGWGADPQRLQAGLDFSTMELLPGELEKIEAWYDRICGEVPEHVRFLGTLRPNLLKAYRNRFENTVRVLPVQMMPWIQLQWEAIRGHEAGIRESVLLCRGLGVGKQVAMNAVAWAMMYGGNGGASTVARAAGDVFAEDW